jgi:hypothetical protein
MDGTDMDTKQFFEKIRRENVRNAESRQVDYRGQVLRDVSVSDSFNGLNADFPLTLPSERPNREYFHDPVSLVFPLTQLNADTDRLDRLEKKGEKP